MTPITDGTLKFVVTKSGGGVLPGTVTAFSGAFKDGHPVNKNTGLVNREWHLCDGTNGTPDLRNRFIYGGDGTNNGATGGEATHKLTVAEMPEHDHTANANSVNIHGEFDTGAEYYVGNQTCSGVFSAQLNNHRRNTGGADNSQRRIVMDSSHSHTISVDKTGGDQPHNNMPPYYVLAFMMKL